MDHRKVALTFDPLRIASRRQGHVDLGTMPRGSQIIFGAMSALGRSADLSRTSRDVRAGRVDDGRGSLGHSATLRFPPPLIEPDVPISGIRLSDWFHHEAHGEKRNR